MNIFGLDINLTTLVTITLAVLLRDLVLYLIDLFKRVAGY